MGCCPFMSQPGSLVECTADCQLRVGERCAIALNAETTNKLQLELRYLGRDLKASTRAISNAMPR